MSVKDMYADLEKIEARGKRKKEKRKGFFSRDKKEETVEPEPVIESIPESIPEPEVIEPEPEIVEETPKEPEKALEPLTPPTPVASVDDDMEDLSISDSSTSSQGVQERPDFCYPQKDKEPETTISKPVPKVPAPAPTPEPVPEPVTEPAPVAEPQDSVDPMNMLEFSSEEEDDSPGQLPPGADPFAPPEDPSGFSSMPVSQPEEKEDTEETEPEAPAEVISMDPEPVAEPEPVVEPVSAPPVVEPTPQPEVVPQSAPVIVEPIPVPTPQPQVVSPSAPVIVEPIPVPTPQPQVVSPPAPVVAEPIPVPEPTPAPQPVPVAEPAWIPLTGSELAKAEAHIYEYKIWLNKGYKAGKFSKQECQMKLHHKEVEIGLRQHK